MQQVELTRELGEGDGSAEVEILQAVLPGRSIVKRGSEIKAGETVLRAGEQIGAAAMAVLASFGYAQISVGSRPRVAVLATGSELVAVEEKAGQGSNTRFQQFFDRRLRRTGGSGCRTPAASRR